MNSSRPTRDVHHRSHAGVPARAVRSFAVLLLFTAAACRSSAPVPLPPVPVEATDLVFAADAALRSRPERPEEAARAASRAAELAPDWVAPRRLLDEIARVGLQGVAALADHRARLASAPENPVELYLAGRLEGPTGTPRLEQAARLAPSLSFAHHGLAYAAASRREWSRALESGRTALACARDPWERTFFTLALARHLAGAGRRDEALALLDDRARQLEAEAARPTESRARAAHPTASNDPTAQRAISLLGSDTLSSDMPGSRSSPAPNDATPSARAHEHAALVCLAVQIGLEATDRELRQRAYERGLEVLRREPLTDADVEDLASAMSSSLLSEDPLNQRLALALAAQPGAAREILRARELRSNASPRLARASTARALELVGRPDARGAGARTARFAAGQFAEAVERWRDELPGAVLDLDGLPTRPELRRVVLAARAQAAAQDPAARAAALTELGESLIAAGWFREARAVADALAPFDVVGAMRLENRALAGGVALIDLDRVIARVDRAAARTLPRARPETDDPRSLRPPGRSVLLESEAPDGSVRDLDGLLGALAHVLAQADVHLGGSIDTAQLRGALLASPRLAYGGVADLVHPGPTFGPEDGRDGRGTPGDPVPGLAAEFARLGRFVLCGQLLGQAPDATVLPLLGFETRAGEHLGVEWHGTIAWCEAADVPGRAGRMGAQISAAALHEGYWVDVDSVRQELNAWDALHRRFAPPGARGGLRAALDAPGLRLPADAGRRERRSLDALLGEANRVRLAVMVDRQEEGGALGRVTLDDLVHATAVHEEGHLCDRTRFLPVSDHLWAVLGFLFDCGFVPQHVGEELEYRAQLTCLAEVSDPRIALAQVLDAAEGGAGITPHAAGYRRLLEDLIEAIDDAPQAVPGVDRAFVLVHQLHRVPPEDLRALARVVARRKGLLR